MRRCLLALTLLTLLVFPASSQSPAGKAVFDAWVQAAGGTQAFDVASVRENRSGSDDSSVNIPTGPEDAFRETGGVFSATNVPVRLLISFAWKITTSQRDVFRASLPDWAETTRFNVEARTDNHAVTKDQMRLMVQSLLQERFHVKIRWETRQVPVYAVMVAKPGALGPGLRPHPGDAPCSTIAHPLHPDPDAPPPPPPTIDGGFPAMCGGFVNMPPSQPYLRHEGGRNLTIAQIVSTFSGMGNLGRPVVDKTSLTGTYDWVMEFLDERPGRTPPPDAEGLTFQEALKKQTGLKLSSETTAFDFLVVDHVEPLSAQE